MQIFSMLLTCLFIGFILTGCIEEDKFGRGEGISYCVIEDKKPRVVCVNGYLKRENPLYGVKQGERPYDSVTTINGANAECYCNPNLVTKEENLQQGVK